jgi:hypothetical protein
MDPFFFLVIFLFTICPAALPSLGDVAGALAVSRTMPNGQLIALIACFKVLSPLSFRNYVSPYYIEPRPKELWGTYMMYHWTDEVFRQSFRMEKASFYELCDLLRPLLKGRDTNFRLALPVETKVAIGLYRLASEHTPFRTLRDLFGVGQATACKVVYQFLRAVVKVSMAMPMAMHHSIPRCRFTLDLLFYSWTRSRSRSTREE